MTAGLAAITGAGVAVSALVTLMILRAGLMDRPNDRSSHDAPTPRAGGLGVVAGLGAAGLAAAIAAPAPGLAVLLAVAAALGALGLLDDMFVLDTQAKFAAIALVAVLCAAVAGPADDIGFGAMPYLLALFGSALWVFTLVNAVNFMDGADGLMAGALIPAALGLALLAGPQTGPGLFALALAAALAGFAVWNAPKARVFAGDAGSLAAGGGFAAAALAWAGTAPGSPWLAALLATPVLADVLLTLLARARAGTRLGEAHRAHAYQLLIRMGWSHPKTALVWAGLAAACAGLALAADRIGGLAPLAAFLLALTTAVFLHARVRAAAKAQGLDINQ
ncbi:MAG: hypothetical protein KIS81_07885 [Maricaulaceae bacterium]|nr:hypothetical protein [Maricaulaceae bacterium]